MTPAAIAPSRTQEILEGSCASRRHYAGVAPAAKGRAINELIEATHEMLDVPGRVGVEEHRRGFVAPAEIEPVSE